MKIQFGKTAEEKELLQKMGDKNRLVSAEAQEIFAGLIEPMIGEVFNQADTTSLVYRTITFNEDEDPSFPLNAFRNIGKDKLSIWSQGVAGGLPSNRVYEPIEEIKFTIYRLDSAISWEKKYARKCRFDVIAMYLERLVEEIKYKQQNNAWAVVMAALASASHNGNPHLYRSITANTLSLADFSKLLTKFRRLNRSWAGGTPVGASAKVTDMVCSPEIVEQLRNLAFNPINTKVANNITPTAANDDGAGGVVTLPDAERARIFQAGEAPEFFGINIIELLELGDNGEYVQLLDNWSSASISAIDGGSNSGAIAAASDDLIIFLDRSKDIGLKAVETSGENASTFSLQPDDQFLARSGNIGWYGSVSEGRVVVDTKGILGLIV